MLNNEPCHDTGPSVMSHWTTSHVLKLNQELCHNTGPREMSGYWPISHAIIHEQKGMPCFQQQLTDKKIFKSNVSIAIQICLAHCPHLKKASEFGVTVRNMFGFPIHQCGDHVTQSRQRQVDLGSFLQSISCRSWTHKYTQHYNLRPWNSEHSCLTGWSCWCPSVHHTKLNKYDKRTKPVAANKQRNQ